MSVRRKLSHARKHIDRMEAEVKAFGQTMPYEIEVVGDPVNGRGSYRIKGDPKPVPDQIAEIAGDAAHNLRTAFDHFACAVVSAMTTNTAFPVWRKDRIPSANDWRGLVRGKLSGASRQLIQAVEDSEAYKTGRGEYVWCIDELDRTDKHIDLIEVAGANTGVVIDPFKMFERMRERGEMAMPEALKSVNWTMPSMPLTLIPKEWTRVERGADLFAVKSPNGHPVPTFTFNIALAQPDVLRGKKVTETLRNLTNQAEDLLLNQLAPLA